MEGKGVKFDLFDRDLKNTDLLFGGLGRVLGKG